MSVPFDLENLAIVVPLSAEQRRREIASILARGVQEALLRRASVSQFTSERSLPNPEKLSPTGLEKESQKSVTVHVG